MTSNLYSRNLDSLTGAVYFVVGRGTEGGSASYQISVAGVSKSEWGQQSAVAQNSGYSLGAIQVDLGQRGTWPLGATEGRVLRESEMTYVDAVIAESSSYAARQGLPYASDHGQLRADLLTHGNGQRGRTSITFISADTRDSINAWAGSPEGQQWIHRNIDYAQVRNATQTAVNLLDKHPHNVSDDRKFETICVLAKTANQFPGFLDDYEHVLRNGGNYDDIARKADELHVRNNVYAGNKARLVAEGYRSNYKDSAKQAAMDNAHNKVSSPTFDPSTEAADLDIQMALSAIGQRPAIDPTVWRLQQNLNALNVTDARDQKLVVDGDLGDANSRTHQAIAVFKQQHGLTEPMSNTELLMATQVAMKVKQSLDFDRPILDGLPGPARTLQMVNGLPDYMVSGPNALSQKPSTAQTPQAPLQIAPSHMPQHIAIPPSGTQRDQAPGSFASSTRAAASEPDPITARLAELQRKMDALRRQMHHDIPSTRNGPTPRHEAELRADSRSAAMDVPSRSRPERESEPEPQQLHPQRDAQAFPTGHRDYALFEAIRRQLPDEYSDDMAAHATLEAKKGGITRPDQIKGMAVENGRLTVMGKTGMDFAVVELTMPAPPLQETLQQSAAFDQQQTIRLAQFQEQQQLNVGRGGPSMTL